MDYKEYALEITNKYQDIIAAYGYGSAFSHQSGYTKDTKKIIDLIFVVDDIKKWNDNNFKINKDDYTKYTKAIFKVAPKKLLTLGTDTIYNIVRNKEGIQYKYGLVEQDMLLNDLNTWKHFFLCGRMQKPIYVVKSNSLIEEAIIKNRDQAVLLSLLLMNQEIILLRDLFEQICQLSYHGDIRTLGAENPNKIKNIVNGNYKSFKKIYGNSKYLTISGEYAFVNMDKVREDICYLPSSILDKLPQDDYYIIRTLDNIIKEKNRKESIIHPIKQSFVSGLGTCYQYMKEKHKKKHLK